MSNSFKAFSACVLVMAFSVAATFGQSSHFDVKQMDTKASACTDFYQYANGGWAHPSSHRRTRQAVRRIRPRGGSLTRVTPMISCAPSISWARASAS